MVIGIWTMVGKNMCVTGMGGKGEPNAPGLSFPFSILLSFHILALVLFLSPLTCFLPRVLSQMNDNVTRTLAQ